MEKSRVDFGELAGSLTLHQAAPLEWNDRCKTVNSQEHDFTGQRMYTGTYAMVDFLYRHPWFTKGRRVVELGCGVGACGILCARLAERMVMTDGEASTLAMALQNVQLAVEEGKISEQQRATVQLLSWGKACAAEALMLGCGGGFEVVLGTDLMYYNVDVEALLVTAVSLLTKDAQGRPSGVFLLAHIFRTVFLAADLVRACEKRGLRVYEIPLAEGGGWCSMRLLCGVAKDSAMEQLVTARLPPGTKVFDGREEEGGEEEGGGEGPSWNLTSMFKT